MTKDEIRALIHKLDEAFRDIPKPEPLASLDGSWDDEEVEFFNQVDWDSATYWHLARGMEGWIICCPETVLYLLPKLVKMLVSRPYGDTDNVVNDIAIQLKPKLMEPTGVSRLLNKNQMQVIVEAFEFIDKYFWYPSGSKFAKELSAKWGLSEG